MKGMFGRTGRQDKHGSMVGGAQLTCRMWSMAPWSLVAPPVPGEAVSPKTWGRGFAFFSLCSRYRLKMVL